MVNHLDIEYAKKLKELRTQSNDKQYKVAAYIGIGQQDYSELENGKTHFTDHLIKQLCSFFKISITEFKRAKNKVEHSGNAIAKDNDISNINEQKLTVLCLKKRTLELEYENIVLKQKFQCHTLQNFTDTLNIYVMI